MAAAVRITGWKHIPCFAHTLSLIVQAALSADKATADLKKTCKDVVTFFHKSTKASDKLKEVQRQLGLPEAKLIQGVETRRNSTYYMFQQIVEQQEAITTTTLCLQGPFCSFKAGELISHKRSRMKPKNVNMFLFLNKNIE